MSWFQDDSNDDDDDLDVAVEVAVDVDVDDWSKGPGPQVLIALFVTLKNNSRLFLEKSI